MTELCDLSALELRRLTGARQISPVELLASCRARTERVNGAVNAFVATCWDRAEAQIDAVLLVVALGPEPGALERHLPAQIRFGQWGPLIRQMRFLAEQRNLAGEAELAQAHGDLRAGLSGADDDHPFRHRRDVARPGAGCNLGGIFE